jgi:hypothetical protein
MRAKNKYQLPVRKEDVVKVVREQTELPEEERSHVRQLKYAVDFLFTKKPGDYSIEGKQILAAADGRVLIARDDSNKSGWDKKYWNEGNFLLIEHDNGECTFYEHMKYKGISVKSEDKVKAGQVIGYSGNTGYTLLSHLHFEVRLYEGEPPKTLEELFRRGDFETLEVVFKELGESF